jgi:hypothetical protein
MLIFVKFIEKPQNFHSMFLCFFGHSDRLGDQYGQSNHRPLEQKKAIGSGD